MSVSLTPGALGPTGPAGATGPTGPVGATGPTGPVGYAFSTIPNFVNSTKLTHPNMLGWVSWSTNLALKDTILIDKLIGDQSWEKLCSLISIQSFLYK